MSAPERIWAEEVFWPNVNMSGDCWAWTSTKMGNGYGATRPAKGLRATGAHRFSWALHNGRWPDPGQVVMHSCDNPACVNPAHLSLGTQAENIQQCVERGRHKPYHPPRNKHCKNGHEFSEENTQLVMGKSGLVRRCRTCANQRNKGYARNKRKMLASANPVAL